MKKTLLSVCCAIALGLGSFSAVASPVAAQDKPGQKQDQDKTDKKLSDRTVRVIMGLALAAIPEELPGPDGKIVKIDRSDPLRFMIPIKEAERIIVQATLSARADLCGLKDLERKHFETIMRHELAKRNAKGEKLWSSYQLTYIDHLMATTSSVMTGSVSAGSETKEKQDGSEDIRNSYDCSDEEREKARAAVEADIQQIAQSKR